MYQRPVPTGRRRVRRWDKRQRYTPPPAEPLPPPAPPKLPIAGAVDLGDGYFRFPAPSRGRPVPGATYSALEAYHEERRRQAGATNRRRDAFPRSAT